METIAVIGAGLMGHGIAQIFALNGFTVHLTDIDTESIRAALTHVRNNLDLMSGEGIVTKEDADAAIERIIAKPNLDETVKHAGFVVEAIIENLEIKQSLFRELDRICPEDVILATNTSVISISQIAELAEHPERVVGSHFWNPPYLIPLVEVIRGEHTSDAVMDQTFDILNRVGKHPVRVNKDVPGFVGNRLQHALWREAISIVEQGIADAATVDECVKFGFGLRLPVLGPMENADLVGTDLALAIHDYILKHLERSQDPSPLLKTLVEQGDLGFKSGRGFQQWPDEKIRETQNRLKTYLLKVTSKSQV